MKLSVEIIIPTLNRPDSAEILLDSIKKQTRMPNKITFIDAGNRSIDYFKLRAEFKSLGIELLWHFTKSGLTYQRNFGIKNISCDIVLFSDDDVVLQPNYFEVIMKVFENDNDKKIGGVTGRMLNFKSTSSVLAGFFRKICFLSRMGDGKVLPSGFANGIDYNRSEEIEVGWLSGCNMAYRREVFDFLWFDENLCRYAYMEDLDFSYRVSKNNTLLYISSAGYDHNQAPQERLKDCDRYLMLIRHHHYLFKKNIKPRVKSSVPHYISLFGIVIQALFLQRSIKAFRGAFTGLCEVLFMRNYVLPNYLERLDHSRPSRIQIAEHEVRYNYAALYCKNKNVLDCALGEGIGANILCNVAQKVTGLDIDKHAIESAKKNIKHTNIEYVHGSALELPFPDNTFDVVTSMETLEHIPEKLQGNIVAEFKRVLKPGGRLILSVPNKDRTSPDKIAPGNYFHLCEPTFETLCNLFSSNFGKFTYVGMYNPLRELSLDKIKANLNNPQPAVQKKSFRKKVLYFFPFWFKDLLSLIINKMHIYPVISEYQLIEEGAEYANNLIFTGYKA